ncbi:class I SAM-dependent methyltransferase [Reichenbachiella agarivorans]|uniref:Class I SAM-dependent methyltransferase n=1 Tax=Reichenbachiella agarivorans TaxID=2979464 RepID=A0ABY6CMG4_9BACT|nr:class I SAM-dependent methyltransferase [Reichenbachiella agarivorans]UXP31715.1 class I SAM-dependent methyltransferase [Reichenbachiella agarivorans]
MNLQTALFRAYRYLIYWLLKQDEHALQAPYIYSFYRHVLTTGRSEYEPDIRRLIESLKHNWNTISSQVGAGSVLDAKTYSISSIVSYGMTSPKYSYTLQRIQESMQAKRVLELGTSLGINAAIMARSFGLSHLVTIEKNQILAGIAQSNFEELKVDERIDLMYSSVEEALFLLLNKKDRFDLIYVDANHTYEATLLYYQSLNQLVSKNHGFMIFDDINWSMGMRRAWDEIKEDFDQGIVIENYQMGILIYKADLTPKQYILNF